MRMMLALGSILLCGCAAQPIDEEPAQKVGIANPASEYCVAQGGEVEIRDGADGQVGYCHLPDGTVVEEWEFFRASQSDQPQ
ncbi:putative hemolysin [Pelagerythrobacter aerophilus]|uniref:DUF333 domain-containing protein n=1 Tax=Pelagerythrobacter aerophilus TaxID=2306995 RepID=A0A418NDQ2_9SPHN|nr:DUF333 domain-containing protein [Pelagerythrobacter aerophilus]RIV75629.1 DUF333 domain-containing protein [Pelagerythrobacter aerophilus]